MHAGTGNFINEHPVIENDLKIGLGYNNRSKLNQRIPLVITNDCVDYDVLKDICIITSSILGFSF